MNGSMNGILCPWRRGIFSARVLNMLGASAEVHDFADIHSGCSWAEWAIWNQAGDCIARGTASTADNAKAVVETLIRDRWNARALLP